MYLSTNCSAWPSKSDHATLVHLIQPPQVAAGTQRTTKTNLSSAFLRRPAAVGRINLGCSDLVRSSAHQVAARIDFSNQTQKGIRHDTSFFDHSISDRRSVEHRGLGSEQRQAVVAAV